ncbi:hypothetical protein ACSFBI_18170 [Variovorax sp. RB3P1]|uniref:hypothetical protein n=1 Tax=Variovorax sp. RB3P1 TaxID=3443732 RepID=UPI003F459BA2
MSAPDLTILKPEVELIGVADAGVANLERIQLRVNREADLSLYAIILAMLGPGGAFPVRDSFFWLGGTPIAPGWIFLHTGPGEFRMSPSNTPGEVLHSWHWNKKETVFQNRMLAPMIIRLDSAYMAPRTDPMFPLSQRPGALSQVPGALSQVETLRDFPTGRI